MEFETVLLIIIIVYVLHRIGLIKIQWSYRWSFNKEDEPGSKKLSKKTAKVKPDNRKLEGQVNSDK